MNFPDAVAALAPQKLKYYGDWENGPDGQRSHAVVACTGARKNHDAVYRPGIVQSDDGDQVRFSFGPDRSDIDSARIDAVIMLVTWCQAEISEAGVH